MRCSRIVLIGFLSPIILWAQAATERPAAGVVRAYQIQGVSADAKIKNAIASLAGRGGVIDARGLSGTQTISSTVIIPANTTIELDPDVVYLCTVRDAPCWSLTGDGAKLLGYHAGSQDIHPNGQLGTILRMGPGITSTTDMVVVNPSNRSMVAGIEVGGLTIDFANLTANTGRYGLATYSMNRSWIHDIIIFNAGSDGFHAETGPSLHSYEVVMDRIYVRAVGRDGYRWDANQNPADYDFDRWICNDCSYNGYNLSSRTAYGANGFNMVAGSSNVLQQIADFEFNDVWVGSVADGGVGMALTAPGPAVIIRTKISGEIETTANHNSGTGVKINSAPIANSNGAGCSNDCQRTVQQIDISAIFTNWATPTNLSYQTATGYSYRMDGVHLVRTDGFQFQSGTLPDAFTYNPTSGITWQSVNNGSYLWYLSSDGLLHIARTDIKRPADYFILDQANRVFKPATDNTGSLGIPSNRWGSVSATQVQLGNSYSFRNLPDAPNGTIVYCSDCNASCTAGSGSGRTCFRENGVWTH